MKEIKVRYEASKGSGMQARTSEFTTDVPLLTKEELQERWEGQPQSRDYEIGTAQGHPMSKEALKRRKRKVILEETGEEMDALWHHVGHGNYRVSFVAPL